MLPADSPISPDMLDAGPRTLKFAHFPVADIKVSNLYDLAIGYVVVQHCFVAGTPAAESRHPPPSPSRPQDVSTKVQGEADDQGVRTISAGDQGNRAGGGQPGPGPIQ